METSLRQSLIISEGAFTIFVTRPISGALLVLTALMVTAPVARRLIGQRTPRRLEPPLA
jgi:TctA family transporter